MLRRNFNEKEYNVRNMKEYKYYMDVLLHAGFSTEKCQFCGATENGLEGVYFDNPKISSICLRCFEEKKGNVYIPGYLRNKIKNSVNEKVAELEYTPPVPWIQYNDWQICCDDFCQFIGEWTREDFINAAGKENSIDFFKSMLCMETYSLIDDINELWESLGESTAAFVFQCVKCNKKIVVCQSY